MKNGNTNLKDYDDNIIGKSMFQLDQAIATAPERYARESWGDGFDPIQRNRKFSLERIIKTVCALGADSLAIEAGKYADGGFSVSSLIAARNKVPAELFYFALRNFADSGEAYYYVAKSGARRIPIAIDGTTVNVYPNIDPKDKTFVAAPKSKKGGYNLVSAVVMTNVLNREVTDIQITPIRQQSEQGVARFYIAWGDYKKDTVLIGDRNFSTFGILASCLETFSSDSSSQKIDFVIRTKLGGFRALRHLPTDREFDLDATITLTKSLSKEAKQSGKVYVNTVRTDGKADRYLSELLQNGDYKMRLRVVSVKIGDGADEKEQFEWLLTSLSREEFSAEEIAELYRLRWREEVFFRLVKHTIGLSYSAHTKERMCEYQSIYAAFLTASLVSRIVNGITIPPSKRKRKYARAIDYKYATNEIKEYLRNGGDTEKLIERIASHTQAIRPNRKSARPSPIPPKSYKQFGYRPL